VKALGKGSVASIVQVGLTIFWILLWVGLAVVAAALIAYCAFLALTAAGMIEGPIPLPGDATVTIDGEEVDLSYGRLGGATWPVIIPALAIALVVLAGGLIIVDRLRRLFDSFTSAEPFRRENAQHLRVIWVTMLVIEVSRYVLMGIIGGIVAVVGQPDRARLNFDVGVNLTNWMAILILIVLAEVFREGARLKEEQELTI
jgi:hypothetical protein